MACLQARFAVTLACSGDDHSVVILANMPEQSQRARGDGLVEHTFQVGQWVKGAEKARNWTDAKAW